MKPKTLLLPALSLLMITTNAQKKEKPVTGFAVTAAEKGGRNWKEVKMIDVSTGQATRSVYESKNETEALNARTKKPVVQKESTTTPETRTISYTTTTPSGTATPGALQKKVVNLDDALNTNTNANVKTKVHVKTHVTIMRKIEQPHKPFSTNSAAMAYDKKHDRLYYTPMNINQLRYIDLKSNKIYYFEDEPFGTVKGYGDVNNQITRMVIASDENGYALSNDGNHLIRFTTGKKPTITDLGALTDDPKNEKMSIHSSGGYGGDMIADVNENLYLVTANRHVFKISIESKVATYLGAIKGLPRGFSTNGAMVEEGSKIIVASSESTEGYFRVDLNTLQAEKVSQSGDVFNASDLANGNLAFEKNKKDKKNEPEEPVAPAETVAEKTAKTPKSAEVVGVYDNNITVYPNPINSNATVKVSFNDIPVGKYQVQLIDISGRLISAQEVNVMNKVQVADFTIPELAKGSYLLKVVSEPNKVAVTNKLVVQ